MKKQDPTKPVGTWEVRRKISIPSLADAAGAIAVERGLQVLPGVKKAVADVTRHQVMVRYDITGSDYRTIVETLENNGYPPSRNWWSRFRAAWYQYTDINGRDNANAPAPPCCSNPKGIAETRRRH